MALAVGCGAGSKSTQDMMYDIRAYNEGLRWDKLPQSAIRIPPAERDAFLDEREQLQDELRIDDYDITRLKTEGESKERAKVQIKWTWHMDREGIVRTTTSEQHWKRHGGRWLMLQEFYLRGDEMPGIAEREIGTEATDSEVGQGETKPEANAQRRAAHQAVTAALRSTAKPNKIAE